MNHPSEWRPLLPLLLLVAVTVLYTSASPTWAGDTPYVFETNFTNNIASDALVGDGGVVYVMYRDSSIKATNLTKGANTVLWEAKADAGVSYTDTVRLLSMVTNPASGEKVLVWAYWTGNLESRNTSIRFLDPLTGADVMPPLHDAVNFHASVIVTPKYFDGNRILMATVGDREQIIEYYANGTARVHNLGNYILAVYPAHAGFSPNGVFFAVTESLGNGVAVFKLEGSDWAGNSVTIPTPSKPRLVRWLDDSNLFLLLTSGVTIDGNDYNIANIVDLSSFPNYTLRTVFINESVTTQFSITAYADPYLDDNGNLYITMWDNSLRDPIGAPGFNTAIWVFSLGQVHWVNSTTGYLNAYPTILHNLDSEASLVRIGPGYIYYRDAPYLQTFESLVSYNLVPKDRGAKVILGTTYTYLGVPDNRLSIAAGDDDFAYVALNVGLGSIGDKYRGDLFVYKMDTRTGRLWELDWLPVNKTLEFAQFKFFTMLVTGMDVSPDGRLLAFAGGIEDTGDHSSTLSGDEKALVRVLDTTTGSVVLSDEITFDDSSNNKLNIFARTVRFLGNSLLLVGIEYFDYVTSPGSLKQIILLYNVTAGQRIFYWNIDRSFIVGNLEAQSLKLAGRYDMSAKEVIVYTFSSSQSVAGSATEHQVDVYSLRIPVSGDGVPVVTNKTILRLTGTTYVGLKVTGAELSSDGLGLYVSIIEATEDPQNWKSLLLKIDPTTLEEVGEVNLTNWLLHANNQSIVSGQVAGLRLVNDTILAYIERSRWTNGLSVNLLAFDKDMNLEWNISFARNTTFLGLPLIDNKGLEFDEHSPTDYHFDAAGDGKYLFILSEEGLHKLVKPKLPSSGESPPPPPDSPAPPPAVITLTPSQVETMKKFLSTREHVLKVQEYLKEMVLNATLLSRIQYMSINEVRGLLENSGVSQAMEKLVESGLVKEVTVKPGKKMREELRASLERLYGPLLERYPTVSGRVYLLYLIYYSEGGG